MRHHRLIIAGGPVLLLTLIVLAGCIVPSGDGSPTIPTPDPTSTLLPASPSPVGRTVDLTNQNSPQAAYYIQSSFTRLGTEQPAVGLQFVAGGFSAPVQLVASNDGSGKTYLVEQTGLVRVIATDGSILPAPFIDVRDRMIRLNPGYDERGLLSMAFHPDYRNNGRVFLYYSRPLRAGAPFGWDCTNVISEFRVMPGNPDMTDMGSEKILLEIHKPSSNHNGGPLLFGPTDGFLYLPVGDGGGAGDTGFGHTPGIGNAQDLTTMLGKVICIDIDHATNGKLYGIPPSNPFVNKPGILPEIYAYGLRNPAYASFDSGGDHHLYVWNAGQQLFESAYRVLKGGNYGWHIREGTHCFDLGNPGRPPLGTTCPIVGYRNEPLIGPIVELGHDLGTTIVGGTIYRGAGLAGKQGAMIHGTWSRAGGSSGNGAVLISTGNISSISVDASLVTPEQNAMWETAEMRIVNNPGGRIEAYVRGVFEGTDHEAYLVFNRNAGPGDQPPTGEVWKLVPADTPGLVNTVTRSPSP